MDLIVYVFRGKYYIAVLGGLEGLETKESLTPLARREKPSSSHQFPRWTRRLDSFVSPRVQYASLKYRSVFL